MTAPLSITKLIVMQVSVVKCGPFRGESENLNCTNASRGTSFDYFQYITSLFPEFFLPPPPPSFVYQTQSINSIIPDDSKYLLISKPTRYVTPSVNFHYVFCVFSESTTL